MNIADVDHRAPHFVVSDPCCSGVRCAAGGRDDACGYRVAWSINPHMTVGSVNRSRAIEQHAVFVRALAEEGAVVHPVPFVHGAYDSVFAKDNAVVVARSDGHRRALLARPRHAVRQAEQRARAEALVALGIEVLDVPGAHLEGGDCVVLPGARGAFMGHGFRSERAATRDLEGLLGAAVVPLELRDSRLYHLDMALGVLDDGTALVCAEALTDASLARLRVHSEIHDIVTIPLREALAFGVNFVQIGRTIVSAGASPTLRRELAARGYRVRSVRLDEYHLAGGSAACLVSRVHARGMARVAAVEQAPASTAA